jgi:hypothetical protein
LTRVRVLYEDKRAAGGPGKEFPLHRLLLCLVADRLGCAWHELAPCFQEVPRNGVDNVIKSLSDYADSAVIAVVDGDRIVQHVAVHLPEAGVGTIESACAALEQRHPGARVVVIPDNVEAVLRWATAIRRSRPICSRGRSSTTGRGRSGIRSSHALPE